MEWTLDARNGSRQRCWVTTAYKAKRGEARAAGAAANAAKREFNQGKRIGKTPAELRPLKTKATDTAKTAKKLHAALGKHVCIVAAGPLYRVVRVNKPARAVSTHPTLEEAQAAAEKVK